MVFNELDVSTRAGFVATVMAILGVLIPPVSMASAVVAIGFSGVGWRRAHRRGESNPLAKYCCVGCLALVVLVVAGSAIYAA